MPTTLTRKPKPDELYVCLFSFAGHDVNCSQGARLRGDHPTVQRFPDRFVPASTPDDELAQLRAEADAPSEPEPERLTGRYKLRILKGHPTTKGEAKAWIGSKPYYEGDEFEANAADARHLVDACVAEIVKTLRPRKQAPTTTGITTGRIED